MMIFSCICYLQVMRHFKGVRFNGLKISRKKAKNMEDNFGESGSREDEWVSTENNLVP